MSVIPDEAQLRENLRELLKERFGFDTFRPCQEDASVGIVQGRDVLAVLPTGSGKSLIYQIPSLYHATGFSIVVMPLLALLQDQIKRCSDVRLHRISLQVENRLSYFSLKLQLNLSPLSFPCRAL